MLHAAAIFVSAFLLFLVQPLIAKQIVPWFGGSAGVWTLCMLFFQLVLLAGYLYADVVRRMPMRRQAILHTVLAVAACTMLPITADPTLRPVEPGDPTLRILLVLVLTIGLPYFMLSTTGPLVQSWFARLRSDRSEAGTAKVYRLFALSNLASLIALVAYPFVVEPFFTLRVQAQYWSAGFVLFAVLVTVAAWRSQRVPVASVLLDVDASDDGIAIDARPITPIRAIGWLILAALGTVMLLSVTTHITQDVASVPFLWILPLSIYLLTFILCFDGTRWYRRVVFWPAVIVLCPAMVWALATDSGVMPISQAIPLFSVGLFAVCMMCHGELARDKPAAASLTLFYLMISIGGAVGGLLVGVVAPHVFDGYWEMPIALVVAGLAIVALCRVGRQWTSVLVAICSVGILGTIVLYYTQPKMPWWALLSILVAMSLAIAGVVWRLWGSFRLAVAVVAGIAVLGSVHFSAAYVKFVNADTLTVERNFYGVLRVRQAGEDNQPGASRRLVHGVIMHGQQYLGDELRKVPTSYYGLTSGAGIAIRRLDRPDPRIGVIGLGAGTLAAYGQPGGTVRYYEINPLVLEKSLKYFSYLRDSKSSVDVALGDARLVLERELVEHHPQDFDVLVVDAFSSDAIPVHLLTREALAIYRQHMRRGGVIAFHITNRYLDLAPVIRGIAEDAGMKAVLVADNPDTDKEYWVSTTDYVLVSEDNAIAADPEIAERTELIVPVPGMPVWTDDYNNLLRILKRSER
ncbi:fused MFS/spermidine synthase [soil metagenome]